MPSVLQLAGQLLFFAVAAAFTGYFSTSPVYRQVPPGLAQVKLSFAHGARKTKDCRRLTTREIAALPPNERRPTTCERERNPIFVELSIDGELIYAAKLEPTGLSRDGPARTYKKFLVPTGEHTLIARLRDTKRKSGFDYETVHVSDLVPHQNLSIDFKADTGGFIFR